MQETDDRQGDSAHDELAGRLTFALQLAERQQTLLAVLALDFRSDAMEPMEASRKRELAESLPAKLQQSLRAMDYVGPLTLPGSIRIVATLQALDELDSIIRRLRRALMSSDVGLGPVDTSIGIAVYPFDTGLPEALLQRASELAAGHLERGKHHYHYANTDLEDWRKQSGDLQESIIRGLNRGEFEVLYQPIVTADSGTPQAVEALVHWRHPQRGVLAPAQFLATAERYSWLLRELDEWVLQEVAKTAPLFRRHLPVPLKISLNVGMAEILAGDFVTHLRRQLEQHLISIGNCLILELPRHALRNERKRIEGMIDACRSMDVGWAIDADPERLSLDEIAALPLEWVKFDTRALRPYLDDIGQRETLRALGQLTAALGSRAVFTHVETAELRQAMRDDRSPGLLQGFGIAEPMAADAMLAWLSNRH